MIGTNRFVSDADHTCHVQQLLLYCYIEMEVHVYLDGDGEKNVFSSKI